MLLFSFRCRSRHSSADYCPTDYSLTEIKASQAEQCSLFLFSQPEGRGSSSAPLRSELCNHISRHAGSLDTKVVLLLMISLLFCCSCRVRFCCQNFFASRSCPPACLSDMNDTHGFGGSCTRFLTRFLSLPSLFFLNQKLRCVRSLAVHAARP